MRHKIFLLGDDQEEAETVGGLLTSAGYTLTLCRESRNALVELQRAHPGLLLVVPDRARSVAELSGLELLCRDAARRRLPVLVLLPYPSLTRDGPWLRSLRCTVLGRPYLPGVLLDTVGLLLDATPAEDSAAEEQTQPSSNLKSASRLS